MQADGEAGGTNLGVDLVRTRSGERAQAWEHALNLTGEASGLTLSQGKNADTVLCRICERHIAARFMTEHTRCCVLASQVMQEAEVCDTRLAALGAKLSAKIDERQRLAIDAEEPLPLARRVTVGASALSALSQLWFLAALWALAALIFMWYAPSNRVARWRTGQKETGDSSTITRDSSSSTCDPSDANSTEPTHPNSPPRIQIPGPSSPKGVASPQGGGMPSSPVGIASPTRALSSWNAR